MISYFKLMTILPVVHLYQIEKKYKLPLNYAIYLQTIQRTEIRALFPLVFVTIKYVMLALFSRRPALARCEWLLQAISKTMKNKTHFYSDITPLPFSYFMLCPSPLYLQH